MPPSYARGIAKRMPFDFTCVTCARSVSFICFPHTIGSHRLKKNAIWRGVPCFLRPLHLISHTCTLASCYCASCSSHSQFALHPSARTCNWNSSATCVSDMTPGHACQWKRAVHAWPREAFLGTRQFEKQEQIGLEMKRPFFPFCQGQFLPIQWASFN